MRSWREAQHDDASIRVAKASDRTTPVLLITVRRTPLEGDLLSPFDEARTRTAPDNVISERRECRATTGILVDARHDVGQ